MGFGFIRRKKIMNENSIYMTGRTGVANKKFVVWTNCAEFYSKIYKMYQQIECGKDNSQVNIRVVDRDKMRATEVNDDL